METDTCMKHLSGNAENGQTSTFEITKHLNFMHMLQLTKLLYIKLYHEKSEDNEKGSHNS